MALISDSLICKDSLEKTPSFSLSFSKIHEPKIVPSTSGKASSAKIYATVLGSSPDKLSLASLISSCEQERFNSKMTVKSLFRNFILTCNKFEHICYLCCGSNANLHLSQR